MQIELEHAVRIPTKGTQAYDLLMAMKDGERLTIWNAMTKYGCGALHQRIKELRDMGWPISRRLIKTNGGAAVAEFWLE